MRCLRGLDDESDGNEDWRYVSHNQPIAGCCHTYPNLAAARHWANTTPALNEPEARDIPITHSVSNRNLTTDQSQPTYPPRDVSILDMVDEFQRNFEPRNVLILPPAGSVRSHPPDPTGGSFATHSDPTDIFPIDEGEAALQYDCRGDSKVDMKTWNGDPTWDDTLDDPTR